MIKTNKGYRLGLTVTGSGLFLVAIALTLSEVIKDQTLGAWIAVLAIMGFILFGISILFIRFRMGH